MKKFAKSVLFITLGVLVAFTFGVTCLVMLITSSEEKESYIPAASLGESYSLSVEENALLERFVAAEGKDEPFVCKVCIAAVVLNRLDSTEFPNSVGDIIKNGDFPSISDGSISGHFSAKETYAAERAVSAAVHGQDPTLGATFFTKDVSRSPANVTFAAGSMIFGY